MNQIKIAEAHANGTPLTERVESPLLPYGLRTVDGSYNNLVKGREEWGAADNPFPRITNPYYRNETDDSITFGAGSENAFVFKDGNYAEMGTPSPQSQELGGTVVDADPRIISNLIVDQTLDNPAAIYAALVYSGVSGADLLPAVNEIRAKKAAFDAAATGADTAPQTLAAAEAKWRGTLFR